MKKILLIIVLLLITTCAFSDEIAIPFDCYPKEIQASFTKTGRKLDLDRNARTRDSWGFLINEGQTFKIYTYKSATQEDFQIITDIVFGRIK